MRCGNRQQSSECGAGRQSSPSPTSQDVHSDARLSKQVAVSTSGRRKETRESASGSDLSKIKQ